MDKMVKSGLKWAKSGLKWAKSGQKGHEVEVRILRCGSDAHQFTKKSQSMPVRKKKCQYTQYRYAYMPDTHRGKVFQVGR